MKDIWPSTAEVVVGPPMQPRDVFDGFLIAVLGIVAYVEIVGPSVSYKRMQVVIEAILNINIAIYLVIGGILGVAYVGYIVLYLPRKQSKNIQ
jgi:hypothetical protein